jgi:hypothetical protein
MYEMKRIYEKPVLFVERFELTQMLSSCSVLIGATDSACVLKDPDAGNYMRSLAKYGYFLGGCSIHRTGVDYEDGRCYLTLTNLVFSS